MMTRWRWWSRIQNRTRSTILIQQQQQQLLEMYQIRPFP